MATASDINSTAFNNVRSRESLTVDMETRWEQSKLPSKQYPSLAVNHLVDTFAKGFTVKTQLFHSSFTNHPSRMTQGFSNRRYK